ncbi:hypothetical protein K466DRAFT_489086 [Polyporus arcularius HHB13444]|uniref:Glycosyltransferase family 1 protein n=1 Tax=Polyporus arcularius HHB13444 TaxID=1314778 RepID=A0A5C3PQK1_9APHY|nr:hypothetical protein K466DRAFT_489086 [Polyporus arcularius HHB13444]
MDSQDAPGQIHVFAQPFPYGFQEVVDDLHLWKHQGVRAEHDTFINFLNSETGDGGVDLIVLGTCQYDLPYWYDALKDAWNRRDADHKFKIVCYVHNAKDMEWDRWIPYWAQRNAIRLLAIGSHVAKAFQDKFAEAADSRDPHLFAADFEHVSVDVHIPVLDIPNLPAKEAPRHLVRAVIQGKFEIERRDYVRIFQELIESLNEDPAAWGYYPLESRTAFEPNHDSPIPPFQLLLVGSQYLGVPDELANVVVIYRDLPYMEFYDLIANSDIVLPAFADNSYYEFRASSTVALATELNVPMLVTNRTRHTYGFIDDDRIVVTRPAAMSEVQALKALRTGDASSFFASDPAGTGMTMGEIPAVRAGVEQMMWNGWVKSKSEWEEWREWLRQQNTQVAERILRDIP